MSTKDQLIASAQKNLEKGQIQKAIKDYQDLLKLDQKADQHRQKLAELLSRSNQTDEAVKQYEILAKGYDEKGFYLKAIAVYKQIQRLDPSRLEIYLHLGELNKKQGMIGNAMAEYRTLLGHYEKKRMIFESADVLQKMSDLEPENLTLRTRVIQFLLAEKLFDKVIDVILVTIDVFYKSGETEKSQKFFESFVQKLVEDKSLTDSLVNALLKKGAYCEALVIFNHLIKQFPDDVPVLEKLVDCYKHTGDHTNERLALSHLVKIDETPDRCEQLVRACLASGDHVRALQELDSRKNILAQAGRKAVLLELFQKLDELIPGNPKISHALQALGVAQTPVQAVVTSEPPTAPPSPPMSSPQLQEQIDLQPLPPVSTTAVDSAEISLDFLEGFVDLSGQVEEVAPEKPVMIGELPEEIELDVELDLDLEQDVPAEEILPPTVVESGPDSELLMEVDLDSGMIVSPDSAPVDLAAEGGITASGSPVDSDFFAAITSVEEETPSVEDVSLSLDIESPTDLVSLSANDEDNLDVLPEEELEIIEELEELEELQDLGDIENEEAFGSVDVGVDAALQDELAPNLLDDLHELETLALDDLSFGDESAVPQEHIDETPEFELPAESALDSGETDIPSAADDSIPDLGFGHVPEAFHEPGLIGFDDLESTPSIELSQPLPSFSDRNVEQGASIEDTPVVFYDDLSLDDGLPDYHAELEELEFFFKQGVYDKAEVLCQVILALDPQHDVALEKYEEIQLIKAAATAPPTEPAKDDFFDLASELLDDGALQATKDLANVEDTDRFRFDSVFTEFKKGIEAQIDNEDAEAHYNLGIAYKEMGLLDDAIGEFEKAQNDPQRFAGCLTLIGICHAEKGSFEEAEAVFLTGFSNPSLDSQDKMGLNYELGLIYEVWGRLPDALSCFEQVAEMDIFFRNVGEKVDALRAQMGQPELPPKDPVPGVSSKNRVSFV